MKNCLNASLLLLLPVFIFVRVHAQDSNSLVISSQLDWTNQGPDGSGSTENSWFRDALEGDPGKPFVFVYRKRLDRNLHVTSYRIQAREVSFLPENLVRELNPAEVESDWKVDARVTDGGGIPYLVVVVTPVRYTAGRIERLESFDLEIQFGLPAGNQRGGGLTFAENSVLNEGTWYKIAIARDGIYRIDRNLLSQLGVDVSTLNPQQINLYGNGGTLLPMDNSEPRADDLRKNAIVVQGEADGSFDSGDYILFYGKGPDSWEFKEATGEAPGRWIHTKHYYSDSAYYFLRIDDNDPLRITSGSTVSDPETAISSVFQDYQFIENDLYNLNKSGREFFGDVFDVSVDASYSFSFPNISSGVPGYLDFRAVSRSIGEPSSFDISTAGLSQNLSIGDVGTGSTSSVARLGVLEESFSPAGNSVQVNVSYNKANPEASGWLDYIRINLTRDLRMSGNQLRFRDTTVTAPGAIARFDLLDANQVHQIWDITDPQIPKLVPFELSGSTATWKDDASSLHEYIAFTQSGYLTPIAKGAVENQNLHSLNNVDLMIITSPLLRSQAEALAEIHTAEGLSVAIATPLQVFNEFSSGNPDVTGFRMLMKMLYDRAQGDPELLPGNLLLFGDGSYLNNKGLEAMSQYNVLVFESDNSLSPTASYVSDDYFVMLSDDDTGATTDALDCGVGRIPASNLSEAESYVSKVRAYVAPNTSSDGGAYCLGDETQSSYGSWRNQLVFVSDDQDGDGAPSETVHLNNSDSLARDVARRHPEYDISKVYMDAYTQEVTPGGERYPDGELAIRQKVQNGALIVTYIGHGGERGWAHERILDIPTIQNWTNKNRLPVFLTATCELARYDDPGYNSAGEILVMNPNGGAIAMLTTTRIVFSIENFAIDTAFFQVALEDAFIENLDLGHVNMMTKNGVLASNTSKPNFSLLGDPALRMAYPEKQVFTTHINATEIEVFQDTLKSLQEVEFRGYVGNGDGVKLTDFNGFIYPVVFDKARQTFTQNNDGGVVQQFRSYDRIIYRGKASVQNGDFSFRFVVPYDINYSVDSGRVSYYTVAGDVDGHGYYQSFLIGSSLDNAELNTIGPDISLFMNDTTFVSGGITNTEPLLVVKLADENGINTVGNGIGHDISAIIDGNTQDPIILNDFYESDLDTYQSGQVRYQLTDLTPGEHTIQVKAWDVHNNSSSGTLSFVVAEDASIALNHVLNYPNPFTTHTEFFFEHNQACEVLDVTIQVFTIGGKLVRTLSQQVLQSGFRSEPIAWDGTDDFGDRIGKGVYVYRVEVRNPLGQRAEKFEKLVILR